MAEVDTRLGHFSRIDRKGKHAPHFQGTAATSGADDSEGEGDAARPKAGTNIQTSSFLPPKHPLQEQQPSEARLDQHWRHILDSATSDSSLQSPKHQPEYAH